MKKEDIAGKMMGSAHHKKPVTKSDKKMSERHLANRAKLDKMAKKLGDKNPIVQRKSIEYNDAHIKEHMKAKKKACKELEKSRK